MDRFIELQNAFAKQSRKTLKSNMDRFIASPQLKLTSYSPDFKIQYG